MLRRSCFLFFDGAKKKTVQQMIRQFKLVGAHPDILVSIDPEKASSNNDALIRLESLIEERRAATPAGGGQNLSSSPSKLSFWVKQKTDNVVRRVETSIGPNATDSQFKSQLKHLFEQAGLNDDFDVPTPLWQDGQAQDQQTAPDVEQVLHRAKTLHTEHVTAASGLLARGEAAIARLQQHGVLVTLQLDQYPDDVFCISMPEQLPGKRAGAASAFGGRSATLDPNTSKFLQDRQLRQFNLRHAGTQQSIEMVVRCVEKIDHLYQLHRGTVMRGGVAFIVTTATLEGNSPGRIAEDGCILLCMRLWMQWEEFLLMLPQQTWTRCQELHVQWRSLTPAKLTDRKNRLKKIADAFHFHTVKLIAPPGSSLRWQEEFLMLMAREDAAIRKTIAQYNLKDKALKGQGVIEVNKRLTATTNKDSNAQSQKKIDYRIESDGRVQFTAEGITALKMLKALKSNYPIIKKRVTLYNQRMSDMERLGQVLGVSVDLDPEWKAVEMELCEKLATFVATLQSVSNVLRAKLQAASGLDSRGNLMLLVSNRFDANAAGVAKIPWDIEVETLKTHLLSWK